MTVAAFATQLNPTLEEVADIKTAVSEAITNCIIHAYDNKKQEKIRIECKTGKRELFVTIIDYGKGIEDIKQQWSQCLRQDRTRNVPVWDLHLWKHLWTSFWLNPRWEKEQPCV